MAKKGGKICPPVTSGNVFYITVPADSKTIIVVSPTARKPYIKCAKVAESDDVNEKNSKALKANKLLSHINFTTDSDDGEDEFVFSK